MSQQDQEQARELSVVLSRMAELPTFLGVTLRAVNDRGVLGDTPLHVAAIWGDVTVGKLLLDAGADPNVRGEYGNTPLHNAVSQRNYAFAKLLVERGASKEVRNDDELTAVDLARHMNDSGFKDILI